MKIFRVQRGVFLELAVTRYASSISHHVPKDHRSLNHSVAKLLYHGGKLCGSRRFHDKAEALAFENVHLFHISS